MSTLKGYIVVNTPASHRAIQRFKQAFPEASFYGKATLGSKRNSYLLTLQEYQNRKEELHQLKMTKAKDQPFLE